MKATPKISNTEPQAAARGPECPVAVAPGDTEPQAVARGPKCPVAVAPGSVDAFPTVGDRFLTTGLAALDALLSGGLPRGRITEISGQASTGRTGLLVSILAEAGRRRESCAYVDAFDMLDPRSLDRGGVDTDRLLWVRCRAGSQERVAQSLKAADIVARAGGFGIVVLDLAHPQASKGSIPASAWFRLQRAIRGTSTALLVLSPQKSLARAFTVGLALERRRSDWAGETGRLRRPLLEGIHCQATLTKGSRNECVPLHCRL